MAQMIRKFRPDVVKSDSQGYTPLQYLNMRSPAVSTYWDMEAKKNVEPPYQVPEGTNPEAMVRAIRELKQYKGML